MPSEAELVHQAIAGDPAAFGHLYELYLDRIYQYIYYRVGCPTDAEDLTEQVFLKAWEAMPRYREQGVPFSAWLYRLAHNLVVDFHRTRKVEDELQETVLDRQAGPDEQLERQLTAAQLAEAIQRLTPDQQQVILLRFVQGLDHESVARVMQRNAAAVRALQHRALIALRAGLEQILGEMA